MCSTRPSSSSPGTSTRMSTLRNERCRRSLSLRGRAVTRTTSASRRAHSLRAGAIFLPLARTSRRRGRHGGRHKNLGPRGVAMHSQHRPFGKVHAVLSGMDSWADTGPVTAGPSPRRCRHVGCRGCEPPPWPARINIWEILPNVPASRLPTPVRDGRVVVSGLGHLAGATRSRASGERDPRAKWSGP